MGKCFERLSNSLKYSETPPYRHLVIMATFFGHLTKTPGNFPLKKTVVPLFSTANFFGPLVTVFTRLHCNQALRKCMEMSLENLDVDIGR